MENTKRVIVADDKEEIRSILVRIIMGYRPNIEIDQVSDGEDLVNKIRENGYCVVFTDNSMLKVNGIEAIRQIRGFNKEIPIYMMSGDFLVEHDALASGANGYIAKPFNLNDIKTVLERHFR